MQTIIATLAGLVFGLAALGAGRFAGLAALPAPTETQSLAERLAGVPANFYLQQGACLVAAVFIGALVSAFLAKKTAGTAWERFGPGWFVGGVIFAMGVAVFLLPPQRVLFFPVTLILSGVVIQLAQWLAIRLSRRKRMIEKGGVE